MKIILVIIIIIGALTSCAKPPSVDIWTEELFRMSDQITELQNALSACQFEAASLNMTIQQRDATIQNLQSNLADFKQCRVDRGNLQAQLATNNQELVNIRAIMANAVDDAALYKQRFSRCAYEANLKDETIQEEKDEYANLIVVIAEFGENITATTNITKEDWLWWYKRLGKIK